MRIDARNNTKIIRADKKRLGLLLNVQLAALNSASFVDSKESCPFYTVQYKKYADTLCWCHSAVICVQAHSHEQLNRCNSIAEGTPATQLLGWKHNCWLWQLSCRVAATSNSLRTCSKFGNQLLVRRLDRSFEQVVAGIW